MCMYFMQRFHSLKKKRLWNDSHLSGWKRICEFFFERVEFQNRGAAHLHIVLWTEATINEMISSNQIRSTMPDPENEPELYAKVRTHQSIRVDHIYAEVLLLLANNASAIFLDLCLIQLIMIQPPYVMTIKPLQRRIDGLSHSTHLHCWLGTPIVIFNMSLVKALHAI